MIYTVTLNPALDYIMQVGKLRADDINRSYFEELHYGGKGINVSVMLTRLGVPNKALGFIAGFTGERVNEMLLSEGVDCGFIRLESGNTRINVKIKSDTELAVNARGPEIGGEDIRKLLSSLAGIKRGDCLVLAGSVPENAPDGVYESILGALKDKGINFVVDACGELLSATLKYKPFLIKPNNLELGDLFGVNIKSEEEIITYAGKLRRAGARNVLVSRGEEGAILLDESGAVTKIGAVKGEIVNTVGAGDSMLAGFLAGYAESGDYKHALRLGAAAGCAAVFCEAIPAADGVKTMLKKI